MVVILVAISIPATSLPTVLLNGIKGLDKLSHFVLFAVLGWLLAYAFFKQSSNRSNVRRHHLYAISVGLFIGVATELCQHFFIPTRADELLDVVANFFGTIFGVCIFGKLWLKVEKIFPELK